MEMSISPLYPQPNEYVLDPNLDYNAPPLQNNQLPSQNNNNSHIPKGLYVSQKETVFKLKTFAEGVVKGEFSFWKQIERRAEELRQSSSSSSGRGSSNFFCLFFLSSNNRDSLRSRKREDNSSTWMAIAGLVILAVGAILLARADTQLDKVNEDTHFITTFKNDEQFSSLVKNDAVQREFYAVMKNARVISDNLLSDVQSRRYKAIGLIVTGSMILIGSVFATAIAVKLGLILGAAVAAKYVYDFVKGDSSEKNKKIAQLILNVIENLQIEDIQKAYQAAKPFENWVPSAPPLEDLSGNRN